MKENVAQITKRRLYLAQSWRRAERAERCPVVQSPAAAGGGPAPAAAGASAPACRAERFRPGMRWAPAKAAGKGWR